MIVLFFVSQTSRELVYAVNPVRTEVVTMGQATGLQIIHNGVDLGDVDITAAKIAIWNSGKESIRKENILKDIIIKTDPSVPILEVSIVKYYRDADVTGFSILESKELLGTGKVPLSWRILEKNDGACIQLIYLGSTDVNINVEGLIEGSGEVGSVDTNVEIESPDEQVRSDRRAKWIFIGVLFTYAIISFVGVYIFFKDAKNWKERIFPILLAIQGTGLLGVVVWYIIVRVPSVPPFGF
ncbi:hypothetical protein ES703_107247 [subsurface metagenome]